MNYKILVIIAVFLFSCNRTYVPKPDGYVRIVYPEKKYIYFATEAPYRFEYPSYIQVLPNESLQSEDLWYDLYIPDFDGTIYLSYKEIDRNLDIYIEDARKLVYKHTTRSDGIAEIPLKDTGRQKYGILYELSGNAASPIQFFVTDSVKHFLRGSLYFESTPNRDSLNPIIDFIEEDIIHLIETLSWKSN